MHYRWDEYSLDRASSLLARQGRQIDVTRKVFDCICHLVEQRHRVVSYDELIRALWGHDNVTNHQLAQVVLSARRTLGDDGQAQRLIRTMPGLGYRWVKAVTEGADTIAPAVEQSPPVAPPAAEQARPAAGHSLNDDDHAQRLMQDVPDPELQQHAAEPRATGAVAALQQHPVLDSSSRMQNAAAIPALSANKNLRLWAAAGIALAIFVTVAWRFQDKQQAPAAEPLIAAATDPLTRIEERLWLGDIEGVRAGLVALPAELNDSPDTRILEIRMHIESARYDRAAQKLAVQLTRSRQTADPVWQARLLTLQSTLISKQGTSGPEAFNTARDAVALLEAIGDKAPQSVVAEALSARGAGYLRLEQFDLGIRDLVHARDILLKVADKRRATSTRLMLAYAWIRMGRLEKALDELMEIAKISQQLQHPLAEVGARNAATRIQIELLRWDEAFANSQRSVDLSRKFADTDLRHYTIRLHALVLTNTGRLREAASLLEETDIGVKTGSSTTATYYLASGNAQGALAESAAMFADYDASSNPNLILSSQEGALLLWTMAAQNLAATRGAMPAPTPAQLEVLQRPQSIPGHIAKGRWLWSRGMKREAETELRLAFEQSMKTGRLFYMTLAAEPLTALLLENENFDAADVVLTSLRGIDPDLMDRDYRVSMMRLYAALAEKNAAKIEDAYRKAQALAGERVLQIKPQPSTVTQPIDATRVAKGMQ
jgi:DNA-binding winged helix-turn-helix (wHTH) protein/tetratricopeptide (TPR) repeat protein